MHCIEWMFDIKLRTENQKKKKKKVQLLAHKNAQFPG
jgi:hypothetical protein